jgi:hypothetical protein
MFEAMADTPLCRRAFIRLATNIVGWSRMYLSERLPSGFLSELFPPSMFLLRLCRLESCLRIAGMTALLD